MSSQDLGGENDSKSSFPCPFKNMIAPDDLKQEALSLWDSGKVLRAWLGCEDLFPLVFSAGTPTPVQLLNDFAAVEGWKKSIEEHCQCHLGHGYRIEYAEIEHSQMGRQRLPAKLVFDQAYDLAAFIDKGRDLSRFVISLGQIRRSDARLMPWCERYPLKVLDYENDWDRLLQLLNYLKQSPTPGGVLRESDDFPVDSKFIEQHKLIIRQLLDFVLPDQEKNQETPG